MPKYLFNFFSFSVSPSINSVFSPTQSLASSSGTRRADSTLHFSRLAAQIDSLDLSILFALFRASIDWYQVTLFHQAYRSVREVYHLGCH